MKLIQQDTAARIWECYREMGTAERLLSDLEKLREEYRHNRDLHAQRLKDSFGCRQDLQLGIPSGSNGHRLYNVSPKLAESVIRAHIASKKAELVEANEQAKIELLTD